MYYGGKIMKEKRKKRKKKKKTLSQGSLNIITPLENFGKNFANT